MRAIEPALRAGACRTLLQVFAAVPGATLRGAATADPRRAASRSRPEHLSTAILVEHISMTCAVDNGRVGDEVEFMIEFAARPE